MGSSKLIAAALSPTGFSGPDGSALADASGFARYLDYIVRSETLFSLRLADSPFADHHGLRHLRPMVSDDGTECAAPFLHRWSSERRECYFLLGQCRISRLSDPPRQSTHSPGAPMCVDTDFAPLCSREFLNILINSRPLRISSLRLGSTASRRMHFRRWQPNNDPILHFHISKSSTPESVFPNPSSSSRTVADLAVHISTCLQTASGD